jgi:uncharacterized RDD family membrane protein YckC
MAEEQWYYASPGQPQQGPVARELLRSMIVTGQIRATNMVWTPGMAQWSEAQLVPELMTAPTPTQQGLIKPPRLVVELSGLFRRFMAWCIDLVVLGALSIIACLVVLVVVGGYDARLDVTSRFERPPFLTEIALGVAVLLVCWIYYAVLESSAYQATLGKLVMGLFVLSDSGTEVTFMQANLRFIGRLISAGILMIGFLMAAWTRRNQALHDVMAGTLVVRRK